jgi:protein MpaA
VEGRAITLIRRGTPGGTKVLVIGVIHGNEDAGVAIIRDLEDIVVPDGVELYLVESMNPDGQRDHRRTNANLVDLNRNFPQGWGPIGQPGDGQYSGTGPASEPETRAIVDLINTVKPDLAIWYHQDLNRIAPAKGRRGRVRQRYADLTGLPIVPITGGTYTGTAANFSRDALPLGVSFIVELGPTLSANEATRHAEAIVTVASELPGI